MDALKQQLLKSGLIDQTQLDAHQQKQQDLVAEEKRLAAQPLAGKFSVTTGKVVFGGYGNMMSSAANLDKLPATTWPQQDNSGTVLAHHMHHWVDAETGEWNIYRVLSKSGLQAYFICHDAADAERIYYKLGKLAPASVNETPQSMYDRGVMVIHRYDWHYDHNFFNGRETPDYDCNGIECFFTDASATSDIEDFLAKIEYLDEHPFTLFEHGCALSFREDEYSYARLHLDKDSKKLNAFLFYSDSAQFKGAKIAVEK